METAKRNAVPEQVAQALAEIEANFAERIASWETEKAEVAERVRGYVIETQQTVKTDAATATFVKGRITWDTKVLQGLALVMPEINQARKIGKPSARIKITQTITGEQE